MKTYEQLLAEFALHDGLQRLHQRLSGIESLAQGILASVRPNEQKLLRAGGVYTFAIGTIAVFRDVLDVRFVPMLSVAIGSGILLGIAHLVEYQAGKKENLPVLTQIKSLLGRSVPDQGSLAQINVLNSLTDLTVEMLLVTERERGDLEDSAYRRRMASSLDSLVQAVRLLAWEVRQAKRIGGRDWEAIQVSAGHIAASIRERTSAFTIESAPLTKALDELDKAAAPAMPR